MCELIAQTMPLAVALLAETEGVAPGNMKVVADLDAAGVVNFLVPGLNA